MKKRENNLKSLTSDKLLLRNSTAERQKKVSMDRGREKERKKESEKER